MSRNDPSGKGSGLYDREGVYSGFYYNRRVTYTTLFEGVLVVEGKMTYGEDSMRAAEAAADRYFGDD